MADPGFQDHHTAGVVPASSAQNNGQDGEEMADINAHRLNAAESALQPSSSTSSETDNNNNNNTATPATPEYIPPPRPGTNEEERQIIKDLEAKANMEGFKLGATYYIIATKWYKSWKDFVRYESWYPTHHTVSRPGTIENDTIIEPGSQPGDEKIRKTCMENYDFMIISEDMWKTLQAWCGGGPPLPRKVINSGYYHGSNFTVEVRPLSLKVFKSSDSGNYVNATFSKTDTIGYFKEKMCEKMGLNPDNVRVWDYHAMNKYKHLEDMKVKLDAAQIIEGQPMLLEEKGPDGKFPELPKQRGVQSYSSYNHQGGPTDPGTSGLVNLGNTCFMNSSLQCLSNTAPLSEYFLSNQYKTDINEDNPLGMKGELAEAYCSLIKDLWSGSHSAIAPRDFKWKLERFAPQFAGYQQHDSQELLAFLLDGLHEDLNRIKKKPYRENPEVDDRPQEEVAQEAWDNHRARNDSVIVDWFQGQLRSTLVCPKCSRVSITFDPFMYLSLPLPMKMTRTITVTLFFVDPAKKPTRYACEVPKYGVLKDLTQVLGEMSGVDSKNIIITDVYNSRFFKQFMDNESLDAIQDRDFICGFEILLQNEDKDIMYFPVICRKEEPMHHPYHPMGTYTRKTLFSLPFVLSIKGGSKLTYKQLYDILYMRVQRFLKLPKGKIFRTTDDVVDESPNTTESNNNQQTNEQEHSNDEQERDDPIVDDEEEGFNSNTINNVSEDSESSSGDEDSMTHQQMLNQHGIQQQQQAKRPKKSQPIFTIRAVDNYGMNDQDVLQDDDKPLGLEDRQTLAINWTEEIVDAYYNEAGEKDWELHSSCRKPTTEKEQEQSISLNQCIDMFTTTEKLGPDDPWYCSQCKEFQQATKKFDLWKLPPILVVHLKRFSYKNRYWREKLETFVDYPLHDLDLSNYVKGPITPGQEPLYELFAVSNHYGSLGGGHYTAYAKNKNDKKWYKFDDSSVQQIDEQRAKTSSAYVVFYRRKDTLNKPSTTTDSPTTALPNGTHGNDGKADDDEMDHEQTTVPTMSVRDHRMDDIDD